MRGIGGLGLHPTCLNVRCVFLLFPFFFQALGRVRWGVVAYGRGTLEYYSRLFLFWKMLSQQMSMSPSKAWGLSLSVIPRVIVFVGAQVRVIPY